MSASKPNPPSTLALNTARTRFYVSNSVVDLFRRLRAFWRSIIRQNPARQPVQVKFEQGAFYVPVGGGSPGPQPTGPDSAAKSAASLYLDLMKRILANVIYNRAIPEKFSDARRDQQLGRVLAVGVLPQPVCSTDRRRLHCQISLPF
jgi:hypothetical protein